MSLSVFGIWVIRVVQLDSGDEKTSSLFGFVQLGRYQCLSQRVRFQAGKKRMMTSMTEFRAGYANSLGFTPVNLAVANLYEGKCGSLPPASLGRLEGLLHPLGNSHLHSGQEMQVYSFCCIKTHKIHV